MWKITGILLSFIRLYGNMIIASLLEFDIFRHKELTKALENNSLRTMN